MLITNPHLKQIASLVTNIPLSSVKNFLLLLKASLLEYADSIETGMLVPGMRGIPDVGTSNPRLIERPLEARFSM